VKPDQSPISRSKAALLHLLMTALVAATCAYVVFMIWFPHPFHIFAGGAELFCLVVGIDLLLGPLLTYAVFNPEKKRRTLIIDLSIIVAVQLAALCYGVHAVYLARPVVVAFEGERFRVVAAVDVLATELSQAAPDIRQLSLTGPKFINAEMPGDAEQKFETVMMAMAGFDIGTRPKFWSSWDQRARQSVLLSMRSFESKSADPCSVDSKFTSAVASTKRSLDQLAYMPLLANRPDWIVLVEKTSGEPLGFAPFECAR
jgi:hypothetical protein